MRCIQESLVFAVVLADLGDRNFDQKLQIPLDPSTLDPSTLYEVQQLA